jgi:4-diphosphocytidyl-2-C-methyl-D-erythritol kinase
MITIKSPAKINWSLYVLDRRADGYHNIVSLIQRIALYDTLKFEPSSFISLKSSMKIPEEQNLVFRAARALQKAAGVTKGAMISLDKDIPSGAGLGGGSSDAAFTLIGLNELWNTGFESYKLQEIGATLGSDVPFFIGSAAAIVTERGDTLISEDVRAGSTLLIVKPDESISTAAAYQAISDSRKACGECLDLTNNNEKLNNIKLIIGALNDGPIALLGSLLHNDFERVAVKMSPVIREIKERLLNAGAVAALLSGSGSAVFGLFATRTEALRASGQFESYWHRVTETL